MTEWKRDGNTIYTLMHAGWRKGEEQFKNRIAFSVYADAEVSAEEKEQAVAEIYAALNKRAQVAELVEAGQDALNVVWAENLVAKKKDNTQYEARTKAVYDKLKAAIAAAEGGK